MKFRDVWHEIARQNTILKVFLAVVVSLCFLLTVLALKAVEKPPLLLERSCETQLVDISSKKHTVNEIETFLKVSLAERFNTEIKATGEYFAENEKDLRTAEHNGLKDKGVRQYIRIQDIQQKNNEARVAADRILAFKEIRAATAIELDVKFARVTRTEKNPYGLIFTSIKLLEKNSEKN